MEHASQVGLSMKREISDRWTEFRLGRNTAEMATLLTSPHAAPLLRDLAREAPTSERAQYLALRLGYMAEHEVNRQQQ